MNHESILHSLNCSTLSYDEWLRIGMALKSEGYSFEVFDNWSKTDVVRYDEKTTKKKWDSFNGEGVTGGSIIYIAMNHGVSIGGFTPTSSINKDDKSLTLELIHFINHLYDGNDILSIVTECTTTDKGKYRPLETGLHFTVSELSELLSKSDNIDSVLPYNHKYGAWFRINPTDGEGGTDKNVVSFKYLLVESDNMEIGKQYKLLVDSNLPIASLIHSGGKSIHALVKIDATNAEQFKKRVRTVYEHLREIGYSVDEANKNPSRLSRLPCFKRGDQYQYLIGYDLGKSNYQDWFASTILDDYDLPPIQNWASFRHMDIKKAPPIIDGVLRQGHKMLISGASKVGKSWLMIELSLALASGSEWLGFQCHKRKVLYINLEIDSSSFNDRINTVAEALQTPEDETVTSNLSVWCLRGKNLSMNKLTSVMTETLQENDFDVIILDPIYKLQDGDENSAEAIAKFCNYLDELCEVLGVSIVYSHHHSKGSQGAKSSIDRMSGSGVFARDADALIDLLEKDIEDKKPQMISDKHKEIMLDAIDKYATDEWKSKEIDSSTLSLDELDNVIKYNLKKKSIYSQIHQKMDDEEQAIRDMNAFEASVTAREFKPLKPFHVFFKFPIHVVDNKKIAKGSKPKQSLNEQQRKRRERVSELPNVINQAWNNETNSCIVEDVCKHFNNIGERQIKRDLDEFYKGVFYYKGKFIYKGTDPNKQAKQTE